MPPPPPPPPHTAFVGRDEKRAPLKTPTWEAIQYWSYKVTKTFVMYAEQTSIKRTTLGEKGPMQTTINPDSKIH